MKPVRTFLQTNAIKALLAVEKPLYSAAKGKHFRNRFLSSVDIPFVGSKVKILKETEDVTYIAKYNDDGTIDRGDFKILNFTDLHLDEDYGLNDKTLQMFVNQIRDEKPDLVILTGDVVLSKYQQIDAVQFAMMMESLGVYWVYAFGNHETREEKGYFKWLMFNSMTSYPHCLSKFGRDDLFGYGNCIVNVMNSETELKQSLVIFDSGRNIREEYVERDNVPQEKRNGYDYIKPCQIKWYEDYMTEFRSEYGEFKSMIYLHIPIPEYKVVADEYIEDGIEKYKFTDNAKLLYGCQYESIGCSPHNSGLFDAMKRQGTQAIFAGHDHVNDFAAIYDGIYLVYNQPGGYNCYTMGDYKKGYYHWDEKDWLNGATVTTVYEDGGIELRQSFNRKYLW